MSFEELERQWDRDGARVRDLLNALFPQAKLRCVVLAYQHMVHVHGRRDQSVPRSAQTLDRLLARLELGALVGLDRILKDAPHPRYELQNNDAALLARPELGVHALLSMQRNGHLRERAVNLMANDSTSRSSAYLALRLTDYVHPVRTSAIYALRARTKRPALLEDALPILARLTERRRGAVSDMQQELENAFDDDALLHALEHRDREVRQAGFEKLLSRSVDDDLRTRVLGSMLEEREPRLRKRAAKFVLSSSDEVRARLLPRLEVDRAPEVRALTIKCYAKEPDTDPGVFLRACFDVDSTVRHLARKALAERGAATDLRARALRILTIGGSDRELVGSLSVLADLGRRDDRELVLRFTRAPGRVGREADRTLTVLEGL